MRLYIHIPFCDSKCGYCAFYSIVDDKSLHDSYIDSIKRDIAYHLESFSVCAIDSVFVGGGTPNIVDSHHYGQIFDLLHPFLRNDCEITCEANPDLITKSWLMDLKCMGLNRLSVGVQSFFSDKLAFLERNHDPAHALCSLRLATSLLDNVSIDLIYDSFLDNESRLSMEVDYAVDLGISHLSAYSLSIDRHSRFGSDNSYDKLKTTSDSYFLRDLLISKGAVWYEVSNFAFPKKCFHNLGYWRYDDYLGVGPGSVSKVNDKRYSSPRDLGAYMVNPTFRDVELLRASGMKFEKIFLGFRSEVGVRRDLLSQNKVDILIDEDICYQKDDMIYANNYFLADEISTWIY